MTSNEESVRAYPSPRKRFLAGLLLVSAGLLPATASFAGQDEDQGEPPVDQARTALQELMQTQRLLGEEKRTFALQKELLADHIELVEGENEAIAAQIAASRDKLSETEKERIQLVEEKEELEANSAELRAMVTALEERVKALVPRLPAPAREKVQPFLQQMPDDPAETKLGTGQRFAFLVGTLNALNEFNREVTVANEMLDLGDGRTALVNALYVGVGQAYYVTAAGDAAGVGTAGETGWVWTPRNEIAADVQLAIDVHESKEPAAFVRLPVTIQ